MSNRRANWRYLLLLSSSIFRLCVHAADDGWTTIHKEGRCAIRGHCGSQSLFGPQLPCPDNGEAEEPTVDVRKKLVDICGDKWTDTLVCCKEEQVRAAGRLFGRQNANTNDSLTPSKRTSNEPIPSFPPVLHVNRISSTYFANSPARLTNRFSSMSLKRKRKTTNF